MSDVMFVYILQLFLLVTYGFWVHNWCCSYFESCDFILLTLWLERYQANMSVFK